MKRSFRSSCTRCRLHRQPHARLARDEEAFARSNVHRRRAGDGRSAVPIDRSSKGVESLPDAMTYMASDQAAGKIVVTL